jgi:hypothetical protein
LPVSILITGETRSEKPATGNIFFSWLIILPQNINSNTTIKQQTRCTIFYFFVVKFRHYFCAKAEFYLNPAKKD